MLLPFIFAIHCGMMNAMGQTKPTSEELRAELKDMRSTAARLMEQASRQRDALNWKIEYLAEHQSRRNHDDCTPPIDSCLRGAPLARTITSAFDRIGREQLSPNKPVTCLQYLRISPA